MRQQIGQIRSVDSYVALNVQQFAEYKIYRQNIFSFVRIYSLFIYDVLLAHAYLIQ